MQQQSEKNVRYIVTFFENPTVKKFTKLVYICHSYDQKSSAFLL